MMRLMLFMTAATTHVYLLRCIYVYNIHILTSKKLLLANPYQCKLFLSLSTSGENTGTHTHIHTHTQVYMYFVWHKEGLRT